MRGGQADGRAGSGHPGRWQGAGHPAARPQAGTQRAGRAGAQRFIGNTSRGGGGGGGPRAKCRAAVLRRQGPGPPRAYVSVSPLVTYGKRKSLNQGRPRARPAPGTPPRRSPGPRCTRSSAPAPSASRSGWPVGTGTTCLRGGSSETPRAAALHSTAPPGPARSQPLVPRAHRRS